MDEKAREQSHILVVDDDADVRDVLVTILETQGYRVSATENGALMRAFLKADDSVAAVILDSLMPGESSASLAKHLRNLGLPTVMISGAPAEMEEAAEHRLQLLWKPFRPGSLIAELDKAFASGGFGQRKA